ncbi:hypothetical protein SAMN05444411_101940 [Lutibacter oricola]|uniref:Uncharacterized protein n=1 Tax=Lutibacter oricola TaxID=762486 RepID=A0A1H2UCI7_9FLAO|nr:hypothetical protein [Lutibacter oricola]SDW53913.1 hypothetical protein SAMN05444411_101940 [Lutibacter oricola]
MKQTKLLLALLTIMVFTPVAFGQANADCSIKYNLFKGDYSAKKYDAAYENWLWCMDNCPKLSVNIYKYGYKIAMDKYTKAAAGEKAAAGAVVERVFTQRLEHYPKDLGKVYSDWATFRQLNGASENEVFELLEKSFKEDPTAMSVKNMYKYFDVIMQRNKSTNPQVVFDTYDEVGEGVELKRAAYGKKIEAINAKDSTTLSSRDQKNRRIYQQILTNLTIAETGLDAKISEISTCENLIPLNKKYFADKQNDPVWLKRAVSRMYNKECTDDPFYDTLVEAYVKADPSPQASVFYAGILMKNGETNKAMDYFNQAIDQETDPYKKAKNLLKVAQILSKKGRKSEARSNAYKALEFAPTMGKAYLLVAGMYASSANSCGTDVVTKRLVYVAAANKALKAKQVDPSISSLANKYIRSYTANMPSKKDLFTSDKGITAGSTHRIGCWIGESVRVRTKD